MAHWKDWRGLVIKKIVKVCATCGSDDVSADAFAKWNIGTQQWEVSEIMDKGHACEACGGECKLEDGLVAMQ